MYAPRSSRLARPRGPATIAIARGAAALAVPAGAASAAPRADAQPPLTTPWTHGVSPTNAVPVYPRPRLTRSRWQNLNGAWQFAEVPAGESPPTGRGLVDRILVPYPVESALLGIQRHVDCMWYRRMFAVPPSWHGGRLLLHFVS